MRFNTSSTIETPVVPAKLAPAVDREILQPSSSASLMPERVQSRSLPLNQAPLTSSLPVGADKSAQRLPLQPSKKVHRHLQQHRAALKGGEEPTPKTLNARNT